ncbi:Formate dehydrogenase H [Planctomycetes bacterium Pan216]|uniref:Formate dehydrogenase H n=1 Tax=Kolteria novifilia TaxID=2527975 RepID=A0A518AWZ1_9BACT|nr:Formate dehydrogenase H [Planctomycetes bacterium Pan216]
MSTKPPQAVSRRGFLQGAAGATALGAWSNSADAGTDGHYPASSELPPAFDFTQQSGALQPDRVVDSACQFCNSLCGLKVHLNQGRVIDIQARTDDPVQQGGLCVKAPMMAQLLYNRDRLKTPLKRVAGAKGSPETRFEPISWDEALDLVAKRMISLRDAGEASTIVNRTTGRQPRGVGSLVGRLFALLGSPNATDVGPVCNDAGGNALAMSFGLGNFTNGYGIDQATGKEDLGAAKFLLFLGTNQAETHPVTFAHLLRERAKTGAKLVVVDPRLTPTGDHADRWIAPKPHTDMAIALAMLHRIIATKQYDQQFVDRWVLGFDELAQHLHRQETTPEWAASVCEVPAQAIRDLADEYASSKPAAIFCNAGISHQQGAFDTYRTLTFLAAITGNIGVPGAGCNFMHNTWPGHLALPPIDGEKPETGPALPVGPDRIADAILTGEPYPVKMLLTAGNPLLSSSNTGKVAQAMEQLDFYVYTGLFLEEAANYADVVLPVPSGLEMETVYMRRDDRAIRWQERCAEPVGQSRPEWEIWIDLAHVLARNDSPKRAEQWRANFPAKWKDYKTLWSEFVARTPAMAGMTVDRLRSRAEPLRWPCPSTDHPGVSTLYLDDPSWYDAAKQLSPDGSEKRFLTPSGKVEIFTPELEAKLTQVGHHALPRFYTHPEVTGMHPRSLHSRELVRNPINPRSLTPKSRVETKPRSVSTRDFPLMGMIGRPSVIHFASVTQWTPTGKQMNGVRLVQIHPKAAEAAGIGNGETVRVESPRGAIEGTAQLWDGIREDTIYVPNTFGPAQRLAEEMGVPQYAAANNLVDDGIFDNLSGQQAYKCFACRVRPAGRKG